jgi:branched-chain amino acid transport system permease protein
VDILLQQLINGLTLGSVYALVALGYTMVYGIIGLINFAHGEVVMIGAMVALSVVTALLGAHVSLPPAVVIVAGLLVAIPTCMAIAYGMERVAYRPLRKAPRLAPLITAIGMSIVLQNMALIIWGRNYRTFPPILQPTPYNLGGASITDLQVLIIVLAGLLMAGLVFVVQRTRLGMAMRATAQNPQVAGLMGIDINVVISAAFVIGAALAAVAGLMVMTYYGIAHYYMGFLLGLKAFTAAVLGGIGNLAGAMLGGILLGIIEALGAGYIGDVTNLCGFPFLSDSLQQQCAANDGQVSLFGSNYQDVFAFFVLIAVLIFRPSGLLGERVSERA